MKKQKILGDKIHTGIQFFKNYSEFSKILGVPHLAKEIKKNSWLA